MKKFYLALILIPLIALGSVASYQTLFQRACGFLTIHAPFQGLLRRCAVAGGGGVPANPAPTVTSITPNTGTTAGGTNVDIGGTGFLAGATCTIGGSACTSPVVDSSTNISCTTPAGSGASDVVCTNTDTQSGTLSSGFTYVAPRGVVFADVDPDWIRVADNDALDITDNMTIALWVERDGTGAFDFLAGKWGGAGFQTFYFDFLTDDTVQFRISSSGGANYTTLTSSVTVGTAYTHIAGTFASGTMKFYKNGVEDTSASVVGTETSIFASTTDLAIGQDTAGSPGSNGLNGEMASIAIWDTSVLSATEIAAIAGNGDFDLRVNSGDYTSAADLVLWYQFNASDDLESANGVINQAQDLLHGTAQNMTNATNLTTNYP